MKHIKTFEQALNESENVATQKSAALDFVEDKGSATWKEIHTFLMNNKGFDPSDPANRGNMASYFSGGSSLLSYMVPPKSKTGRDAKSHGLLMIPTDKDPRYLEKSDGKYVVKIWDKKNKL